MTSSSPGGALPARHSSLKTHTHSPGNGLYQHTHTPGEITNIDADTQAQTRMRGNGPHQRRAAGVCANANKRTLENSHKPEITSPVHVNLTPPLLALERGITGNAGLSIGSLSLVAESFSPPSREALPAWGTPCGRPGGAGRAGKGPRDTGGRSQERTHGAGGTVIPPKRVGLRD